MRECIERLERYIKKHGYTYKAMDIVQGYRRYYKPGWYCSYTMNLCIEDNMNDVKFLYKKSRKKVARRLRK